MIYTNIKMQLQKNVLVHINEATRGSLLVLSPDSVTEQKQAGKRKGFYHGCKIFLQRHALYTKLGLYILISNRQSDHIW